MGILSILLVVDVTAGIILGILYLCTIWEARRRVRVPILALVSFRSQIVAPEPSGEVEKPIKAEPATTEQLDLAVPVVSTVQLNLATLPESHDDDDEDTEPEPEPETCEEVRDEWSGYPWYDSRACWGCEKGCKASKYHPYQGSNIGAEIRAAGYSHAHGAPEEPYHAGFAPSGRRAQVGIEPSTSVGKLWESTCEACGRLVRRVQAGLEPVRSATVAVAAATEVPF